MSEQFPGGTVPPQDKEPCYEVEIQQLSAIADRILELCGYAKSGSQHHTITARWQTDQQEAIYLGRAGRGPQTCYYLSVKERQADGLVSRYYRYQESGAGAQECDETYQPLSNSVDTNSMERTMREYIRTGIPEPITTEDTDAARTRARYELEGVFMHQSTIDAMTDLRQIIDIDEKLDSAYELKDKLVIRFGVDEYVAWERIMAELFDFQTI